MKSARTGGARGVMLAFTKHCKKQYGIDLFVATPAKPGQKKVKKPRVFQLFGFIFWVCNVFFSTR